MSSGFWFALAVAAAIVLAAGFVIRRLGPGVVRRSTHCPEKNVPAKIEILRKEGTWGTLLSADVLACSLLPGGHVDCSKHCLRRG